MCGIAGVFGPFSENDVSKKIETMCENIHHRGPDDKGITTFPQVAIGMTRLSIIDLAGGHQPIWIDDKVGIVFNGEIYNYKEIREELLLKGVSFNTHSDTEVILQLYYQEGIKGLEKLEGMYGICLLDKRTDKATIIRDPIGIKPIYYGEIGGGFYFASEIKSIVAACDQKPEVNMQAVHDYLSFRYIPGPQTIWNKIHKLQPGHIVEYDLKTRNYSIERYWKPNFHSQPNDPSRNYVQEFEELFLKSVNQQLLASDVPVGAFLSGGLDSSAICAAAVELGHTNFHTYSVAFEGDQKHSELNYARMAANFLKTDHHEVIVSAEQFTEFMDEQPWYTDEPMADLTSVPLYFLSKEAKKDVKAVLSGEGADEFLAGYQYDEFQMIADSRKRRYSNIPNFLFKLGAGLFSKETNIHKSLKSLGKFGWGGYIRPHLYDDLPNFSEEDKNKLWKSCAYADSRRINGLALDDINAAHPLDVTNSLQSRDWLVEDLLMKADKVTMAASLEGRVPFLSKELMNWCLDLPIEWKVGSQNNGYTTKRVLREFSDARLPREIIYREKKGFPLPIYDWLNNQLKSWAEYVLFEEDVLEDWFEMAEVKKVFDRAVNNSRIDQENIIILITLAQWKKKWL